MQAIERNARARHLEMIGRSLQGAATIGKTGWKVGKLACQLAECGVLRRIGRIGQILGGAEMAHQQAGLQPVKGIPPICQPADKPGRFICIQPKACHAGIKM